MTSNGTDTWKGGVNGSIKDGHSHQSATHPDPNSSSNSNSTPEISISADNSLDSSPQDAVRPPLTSTPSNRVTASNDEAVQLGRKSKRRTVGGAGFGRWYDIMRFIGRNCDRGFFRQTKVIGKVDQFPEKGPVILVCTHFSTIMDVAIISGHLPYNRKIHYWAKRGLFKRPFFAWILNESGNIQVDRTSKNNQKLFAGTFEALKAGECIGLFPEGGSFTQPNLHAMKAGAAWAALEYAKHLLLEKERQTGADEQDEQEKIKLRELSQLKDLKIVPASINYTDKSRFRTRAVFEFGSPFSIDDYTKDFLASPDSLPPSLAALQSSAPPTPGISQIKDANDSTLPIKMTNEISPAKYAVNRLTKRIESELNLLTINAPDWIVWHSMKMSRELLWRKEGDLDLAEFKNVSNALITIFTKGGVATQSASSASPTSSPLAQATQASENLVKLSALLIASRTDLFTYNSLCSQIQSQTLSNGRNYNRFDENIPTLYYSTKILLANALSLILRLPYALPVFAVHTPAMLIGWSLSKKYASHEEESMASAKSICGFVIVSITYMILFFLISLPFLFTPPGLIIAFCVIYVLNKMQLWIIDDIYDGYKSLGSSYRLFETSLSLTPPFSNLFSISKFRQLKESEPSIQLAFEAIKDGPPTNWTYKKAAINNSPKVKRPMAHQLISLTLQIRKVAVRDLKNLFQEIDSLDERHVEGDRSRKFEVAECKRALEIIRRNHGWLEIENDNGDKSTNGVVDKRE